MPKNTFFNLTDDKKQRIFNAAVQAFSVRRFSEASINQVVKNAGIPKGSFYQYFNDKEDLYLYMLEEIQRDIWKNSPYAKALDPEADIFETFIQSTKESFKLDKIRPEYTRIGMLMEIDNSEFITKLRIASAEKYIKMIERDKQRGLIKPETDSELVMNMMLTFGLNEYFRCGFDETRYLKKVEGVIQIIKDGIAVHQD